MKNFDPINTERLRPGLKEGLKDDVVVPWDPSEDVVGPLEDVVDKEFIVWFKSYAVDLRSPAALEFDHVPCPQYIHSVSTCRGKDCDGFGVTLKSNLALIINELRGVSPGSLI